MPRLVVAAGPATGEHEGHPGTIAALSGPRWGAHPIPSGYSSHGAAQVRRPQADVTRQICTPDWAPSLLLSPMHLLRSRLVLGLAMTLLFASARWRWRIRLQRVRVATAVRRAARGGRAAPRVTAAQASQDSRAAGATAAAKPAAARRAGTGGGATGARGAGGRAASGLGVGGATGGVVLAVSPAARPGARTCGGRCDGGIRRRRGCVVLRYGAAAGAVRGGGVAGAAGGGAGGAVNCALPGPRWDYRPRAHLPQCGTRHRRCDRRLGQRRAGVATFNNPVWVAIEPSGAWWSRSTTTTKEVAALLDRRGDVDVDQSVGSSATPTIGVFGGTITFRPISTR